MLGARLAAQLEAALIERVHLLRGVADRVGEVLDVPAHRAASSESAKSPGSDRFIASRTTCPSARRASSSANAESSIPLSRALGPGALLRASCARMLAKPTPASPVGTSLAGAVASRSSGATSGRVIAWYSPEGP